MPDRQDSLPKTPAEVHDYTVGQRLGLLILNYTSIAIVAGVLCVVLIPWGPPVWRWLTGVAALYVGPPLLARVILRLSPIRLRVIKAGSADFFTWWAVFNLQVIFCRFPVFEEVLRVAPGVYSAWLRLWGSRIGRLTYWSAGTRILDRSFLEIGDDVVLGAAVRLNPHVMARNDQGKLELILAPVTIGDRAVIGGYALLTAGTEIPADENTRACLLSPPFSKWKNGQRVSA